MMKLPKGHNLQADDGARMQMQEVWPRGYTFTVCAYY